VQVLQPLWHYYHSTGCLGRQRCNQTYYSPRCTACFAFHSTCFVSTAANHNYCNYYYYYNITQYNIIRASCHICRLFLQNCRFGPFVTDMVPRSNSRFPFGVHLGSRRVSAAPTIREWCDGKGGLRLQASPYVRDAWLPCHHASSRMHDDTMRTSVCKCVQVCKSSHQKRAKGQRSWDTESADPPDSRIFERQPSNQS
jgi:hypothetical protein